MTHTMSERKEGILGPTNQILSDWSIQGFTEAPKYGGEI